jgi:hypothetical protein
MSAVIAAIGAASVLMLAYLVYILFRGDEK